MITDIVSRLKSQVATLKLVEGALDYAAVQVQPPAGNMPAVYVVELAENFAPASGMSGAKTQDGVASFGVILWMAAARLDVKETPAALETLRTAIKNALFGWAPPGANGAEFAHAGGRLLVAEGNLVVWQQTFSLQFEERQ